MNSPSIKQNILAAGLIQIVDKLSGYAIITLLAHSISKTELGSMFFAATISAVFASITSFGTATYLLREVAMAPQEALTRLSEVISVRLVLMAFCWLGLNLFFLFAYPALALVMLLTSTEDFLEQFYYSFGAFFLGHKQMGYRLLTSMSLKIVLVVLVVVVVLSGGSLVQILFCYVFSNLLLVLFAFWLVRAKFGPLRLNFNLRTGVKVLRHSFPFFIFDFLTIAHFQADTIMVGLMLDLKQVASYALGIKLLEVAQFIVRPLTMVFLPLFSELAGKQDFKRLNDILKKMLVVMAGVGALGSLVMLLAGAWIVVFLFGINYTDSVLPVQILFLSVPFIFIGYVATFVANAIRLEKLAVVVAAFSVGLNILANLAVIPRAGIVGAAWMTVLSEFILAALLLCLILRRMKSLAVPYKLEPVTVLLPE
jgi:O-antigen/teichoic acid export membrane protein